MKIGILNLPFDNNYGGNLQRYALVHVLQSMGHDVTCIYLRTKLFLPWYKKPYSYTKRLIKKILRRNNEKLFLESDINRSNFKKQVFALSFYKKYINHTEPVYDKRQVCRIVKSQQFDAVIVGSDQVWRKSMTKSIGFENFFLKFVSDDIIKIAFSVSLGTSNNEYTVSEVALIQKLYSRFKAVSVREMSALSLFEKNGWIHPHAECTLDPTLLLTTYDYNCIINKAVVEDVTTNKAFCYILDMNNEVERELGRIDEDYIVNDLCTSDKVSIEQWLNNIKLCNMVLTDSYHGVVFSIIFNKPFKFMGNQRRGNDRVESLFFMLGIDRRNTLNCNWDDINMKISENRAKSKRYLELNLKY